MDRFLEVPEDPVDLARELAVTGRADGLPVVPPTEARVARMLEAADGDEDMGWMPPSWGAVTPFTIAVNAVMAGCAPEHMPLLRAVARALLDPDFNLYGVQVTANPVAPLTVVHGPAAVELGVNGGTGAFGPGAYANAVIGRAVRFMLMNIGGAVPGELDRATQGLPSKYSYCVAENEAESPWAPFHARRGLSESSSAVTVFAAQAQHNIARLSAKNAEEFLQLVAAAMAVPGTNNLQYGGDAIVALPPENARLLDGAGFHPATVAHYLHEHARVDATQLAPELSEVIRERRPNWIDLKAVPVTDSPDNIHVMVIGGPLGHSQFLPGFGPTLAVTRAIEAG